MIIDSGLKGSDYVSFVATDNEQGGAAGGERTRGAAAGRGKVVLLRYAEGSGSTDEARRGIPRRHAGHPELEVVSSTTSTAARTSEGAYKKSESLLSRYKNGGRRASASTESSARTSRRRSAMLRVLEENGWAGKVRFVGFDASDNLVKGLSDGHIDGLVVQDPVKMGYLGVKTLVAHIKGQPVEKRIDTGVQLVTPDEHGRAGDEGAARIPTSRNG